MTIQSFMEIAQEQSYFSYEEDDTDLTQDEDDTDLEHVCICGNVCMECLGLSERDFM